MRGHLLGLAVAVVVAVVDHQAPLLGVLEPPDLPEQFRTLSREHGAVDELDGATMVHNLIYYTIFWRFKEFQIEYQPPIFLHL